MWNTQSWEVLNARLWMLIGTLYQKLEGMQWYKGSCACSVQLHGCCYYESLSCWALYIKLYSSTDLRCPKHAIGQKGNCTLYHGCSSAVFPAAYSKPLRSTLSVIDRSCTWIQIRKLLQERVFPRCEKFGTWSSSEERVNWVPNRKVPQELEESSVLGPQKRSMSRLSPEQENTIEEIPNSFSACSSKRLKRE